ncbi:MAG: penicillin-binding transpeptidase domain-containing protein [Patescibacteria group bacterium]
MKGRIFIFWFFLFFCFGILILRLFQLTIIEGALNRKLSDEQRIRLRKITAPRGMIYDRNGRPLVRNVPIFKKCPASGGVNSVRSGKCEEISREKALSLEAQGKEADLAIDIGREYPFGEAMAHLLGYLGEVTENEIQNSKCKNQNYKLGDLIGRTGIEEQYECLLRGVDGGELVEVDTEGKTIRKIGKKEPVLGTDITLSIDSDLQVAAFKALKGRRGAVVAQNPNTGEVLALVSTPSFNPNNIEKEVLTDPGMPFFNRAISGAYPPGSTFKIITATAGLEEGKISSETKILDPGEIVIGKYRFSNWYFTRYGKTEGVIDLVRAIKRSTDTFFYKVGEFVGATKLVEWGKVFGLGQVLGIDIPGEISGFLPEPASPQGGWFLGNTYHLSIGQGNLGLTPLQVNTMTQVIANGGKLCRSHLATEVEPPAHGNIGANSVCFEVGLKSETINLISEGMREACSPGGTAFPLFDFKPQVACKTGTAEFGDPAGRTHAWLTAFAPTENPEIVVTALVEAGGEGSSVAAPIVKKVLEEWFRK